MKPSCHNLKERYALYTGVLFLIIFFISGLTVLEKTENKRFFENQRRSVVEQLSTIRAKLEGDLNAEMLLAQSIVSIVATNKDITKDRFSKVSDRFFKSSKHIRNIGLAKGTILTYVYPMKGNEKAIGLDYKKTASQWPAVKQAIIERKTVIAGPLTLVQGGVAIIGRTPIFSANARSQKEEYFGILSIVINIPSLFEAAGLNQENSRLKVSIKGKDGLGAKGDIFHGSADLFADDPILMEVSLPEGEWLLAATPMDGWKKTSENIFYYRIVALIVGIVILLLFFAQQREAKNRKKAEEKLLQQKKHYLTLFENSSDAIFILNSSGEFMSANPVTLDMFDFQTEKDFIKQSLDIVSPEHQPNGKLSSQEAKKWMMQAYEDGVSDFDWVHKRACGKEFHTHVRLVPIMIDDKVMFQAAVRDITKRKKLEDKLKRLSNLDALTGLGNRRTFDAHLKSEWKRLTRSNKCLALIMCDVDYFKTYNDTYGHQKGDDVLTQIAGVMKTIAKRPGDLPARYGGEEFAIILPETNENAAMLLAYKLVAAVENLGIEHQSSEVLDVVTMSVGVATLIPNLKSSPEKLISVADKALFGAKKSGRNRVACMAD